MPMSRKERLPRINPGWELFFEPNVQEVLEAIRSQTDWLGFPLAAFWMLNYFVTRGGKGIDGVDLHNIYQHQPENIGKLLLVLTQEYRLDQSEWRVGRRIAEIADQDPRSEDFFRQIVMCPPSGTQAEPAEFIPLSSMFNGPESLHDWGVVAEMLQMPRENVSTYFHNEKKWRQKVLERWQKEISAFMTKSDHF